MIEQIRRRFEEISYQRDALGLCEELKRESREASVVRRPSSSLPDTTRIYGRGGDKDKVISMLLSSDGSKGRNLRVLPIVGMGGVGKTTLVQHVYNDQRICDHFQLKGWVCVSDESAVVNLTKRIIESLSGEACQLNEFDVIQNELIYVLQGKRFLIVLDDVWDQMSSIWDSLLKPFRLANMLGSAVIMTTRIETVARMAQPITDMYRLDCLSVDDCKLIFEQNAFFGRDPKDHMDSVHIDEKIVKKCGGLPLAVRVLGSLLRNESDCDMWEEILQNEIWELQDQHNEIIPALRLSYLRLPSYLKPCFLYASVFPKDWGFYKQELVPLWMAQGFIRCEGRRKPMEDVGSMYFDDLVQRSLFSFDHFNEKYVMHDLIHDLAQYIWEGDGDRLYPKKVCHVFMFHEEIVDMDFNLNYPCAIRSFFGRSNNSGLILFDCMLKQIEFLRVLNLEGSKISELPDSVGNLKHLRYLSLSFCPNIEKLPESVCNLYHLAELNLNHCSRLQSLPKRIGGLPKLRCLHMDSCLFSYPTGILGRLTNLQSLFGFSVDEAGHQGLELLKDLVHLRGKLVIDDVGKEKNPEGARTADLRSKKHIRELELNWGSYTRVSPKVQAEVLEKLQPPEGLLLLEMRQYRGLRFPSWMDENASSSLSRLTRLHISDFHHCSVLPPLGQLPSLKQMEIVRMSTVSTVGSEFFGFPALEELTFLDMYSWMAWETPVERGDFPRLRRLGIGGCDNLETMVPLYLLPALQYIHFSSCSKLRSIQLKSGPSSTPSFSSSSTSSLGPPPLKEMLIYICPLARFSPEDEPDLLPPTLQRLEISWSPLLKDWCRRDGGSRVAHIAEDGFGEDFRKQLKTEKMSTVSTVGSKFSGFPVLEELDFACMDGWTSWVTPVERGDFPCLRRLEIYACTGLETMVPLYLLPALQELQIRYCSKLTSIQVKSGPSSTPSSSSSTSSLGPPSLKKMDIELCPLARFSPEDDPDLLPHTLGRLRIWWSPLLAEWCGRDGGSRVAHIPYVDFREDFPLKIEKISTAGSKFSDFPALEELDFGCMYSWTSWATPVEMGDFPRLRILKIDECEELETMVPLYLLPALQVLAISRCSKLTSIQLKSGPSSTPSSSSSTSSLGPPTLQR